ncbi:MAG: rane protein [Flavipsychrobacter sp.]|jgi:membrane associated rhomboid family serine protease|nr:rane protein [Flavipsychrobacter sp.]
MLTISIIIITVIVSLAAFSNHSIFEKLCLHPYVMNGNRQEIFRFISVAFIHADIWHLAFNMLTLYFFGTAIEGHVFSETQYILFYVSAIILSGAPEYMEQRNNPEYKACGASGAVSAVLFSLVLFQPWGIIYLKFIIPIYFILFAVGYLAYSYYMSKRRTDNIGHNVHLWGALYGIAFTLLCKPESFSIFMETIKHPPFLN